MLKFFRIPFATSGDKVAVPDPVDVNGSVTYTEGYGFDYERQDTDPAVKYIERTKMNELFFDVTTALAEIQSQGAPDFITSALNGGTAYSYAKDALVRYGGSVYYSLADGNSALPTDATKWQPLITRTGRVVDSIAALRLVAKSDGLSAFVLGYYAKGDGGGGEYYYDSSDTTSADNGGTIIVGADGGRWKLRTNGEVSVRQFGAKGDGVADDRPPCQAAIDCGLSVYAPYSAAGYLISARLQIPAGTRLRGDRARTTFTLGTAGEWAFEIRGSNVTIESLNVDCSVGAGGGVFLLRTDVTSMERVTLRDIQSVRATMFAQDVTHASNISVLVQLQRCLARTHRGGGVDFRRAFAYLSLEDVTIDYVGSGASNFQAYQLRNNAGSVWTRVDVTGGTVDGTTPNNDGFFFANCAAVWMTDCMADTVGGNGFYLFGQNQGFYFTNCVASLCGKTGFAPGSIGGVSSDLMFNNCASFGRNGLAYSPLYSGFQLDGVNKVQLTGCKSQASTGSGIYLNASTRVTVTGGRLDGNGVYGLDSAGTGSCIITGVAFEANTTGNVNLSSTNMHAATCQAASGALFTLAGPGTA